MKASEIFEGENSSLRKTFDKIHTGDSWRRGFLQGAKEMKKEKAIGYVRDFLQKEGIQYANTP